MRAPTPLIAVNFSALVERALAYVFDLPLNEQIELLDLLFNLGYRKASTAIPGEICVQKFP